MNNVRSGGGVRELAEFSPLVDRFLTRLPTRLDQFDTALQANDWLGVERLAHQVKGASSCYGFPDIAHEASRIEVIAKNKSNLSLIREGLEKIRSIVRRAHR